MRWFPETTLALVVVLLQTTPTTIKLLTTAILAVAPVIETGVLVTLVANICVGLAERQWIKKASVLADTVGRQQS